eukprot:UN09624
MKALLNLLVFLITYTALVHSAVFINTPITAVEQPITYIDILYECSPQLVTTTNETSIFTCSHQLLEFQIDFTPHKGNLSITPTFAVSDR